MHKRKGVLASSSALLSSKLCIFFPPFSVLFLPFLSFSASFCPFFPFPVLFYPFLPFLILFYPFSTFFYSFRLLSLLYSAFAIYLSSLSFLLFLAFIILKPFYSLIISFTLVPVSFISVCSLCFIYSYSVVVIILLMCLSLYSLLPECLDALPRVPEVLYHL